MSKTSTQTPTQRIKEIFLFEQQEYFAFSNEYQYLWLSGGVGTGKTTHCGAIYKARRMLENPETIGIIGANSYKQLTQSTLRGIFKMWKELGFRKDVDYVVHRKPPAAWPRFHDFDNYHGILTWRNGRTELLWSFDRPELIEGVEIGDFLIDETRKTKADAWRPLIERLRCPNSLYLQGRVISAPEGENWLYKEFKKMEKIGTGRIVFMSTLENTYLRPEYVSHLLDTFDPEMARQELHGRIVNLRQGRIYYMYDRTTNGRLAWPYDPTKPLILCFDFNILSNSPISAVLCQEHWNDILQQLEIQVFDEIVIKQGDTYQACYEMLRRYEHIHQGEVWIFGDYSGKVNATISEFQIIREVLITAFKDKLKIFPPKPNPRVMEVRVPSVNAALKNSRGRHRLFIDPDKCPELTEDLEKLLPKDNQGGGIDKSDPLRSHTSDGLGYYIVRRMPAIPEKAGDDMILGNYRAA